MSRVKTPLASEMTLNHFHFALTSFVCCKIKKSFNFNPNRSDNSLAISYYAK